MRSVPDPPVEMSFIVVYKTIKILLNIIYANFTFMPVFQVIEVVFQPYNRCRRFSVRYSIVRQHRHTGLFVKKCPCMIGLLLVKVQLNVKFLNLFFFLLLLDLPSGTTYLNICVILNFQQTIQASVENISVCTVLKMTPQRTRNSCACALYKFIIYIYLHLHYIYIFLPFNGE